MRKPTKNISYFHCVGVDEAGRGSWAGPVVAGACIFSMKRRVGIWKKFLGELKDSKKISEKKRELLFDEMNTLSEKGYLQFYPGVIDNICIDSYGIREANRLAMNEALSRLSETYDFSHLDIYIDGRDNNVFEDFSRVQYLVHGDSKILQIMCAALCAKVTRDRMMRMYENRFSGYYFDVHKGYGTKKHQEALYTLGVCDIHRKSYKPIKNLT